MVSMPTQLHYGRGFNSFLPCSHKPRVLLLSLVAFFYVHLPLYNTTTEGRRLPRIHNIRILCYMLQGLLHTVTILLVDHAVTNCYILLQNAGRCSL